MGLSEKINLRIPLHAFIGGFICFGIIFLSKDLGLVWMFVDWLLKSSNCIGALIFEEARIGYYLITLGLTYLPSGFLGGLYAGYKIKDNLKVNLIFPGFIGFAFSASLEYFYMGLRADYMMGLLIPILVIFSGTYLGGYTINWRVEEKLEEEKISLLFKGGN